MAELLIRIVDKTNGDGGMHDRLCMKAGDVVAVCPDGWPWGKEEVINSEWVIVQLPGVDHGQFFDMLRPMLDAEGAMLLKREHYFDPAILRTLIAGGKRQVRLSSEDSKKLSAARRAKQAPGKIVLK